MALTTNYMGLKLRNPLVSSASPLSFSVDMAKRLEDAGIAAIVMYSLFEEQILQTKNELDYYLTTYNESFSEAAHYFPKPEDYPDMQVDGYLAQIQKLKAALDIPVIASLNGVSIGGWMSFAKQIEAAGADGLELNVYFVPTDPGITGEEIERIYLEDLGAVKTSVNIPVAMKLSPYFSAFSNMAMKLDKAGADALVLFNRFYQPDIDLEEMDIVPNLRLSHSYEIRLPLRWISILFETVKASLAATSGVHTAEDVIKLIMAGADVAMLAAVLIKEGPAAITRILDNMQNWMEDHEYESILEMKGRMSYIAVAEPAALVRANYIKTLHSIH